jgi:hypothetical protein
VRILVVTNSAPKFYEVVGVPGAGKTTFIRHMVSNSGKSACTELDAALVDEIVRQSPKARAKPPAHGRMASSDGGSPYKSFIGSHFYGSVARFESLVEFASQHGPYAQTVIGSIAETSDTDARRLMLTWLLNLFAKYQYVASSKNEDRPILIDEGFVGRVVTLFAYRPEQPAPETLRNYVRLAPKPDAVIRLNADLKVCHSRLGGRPKGPPARFRALTKEQQLGILKNCSQSLDVSLAELSTLGVRVVEIDSGRSPDEQVASAVAALDL